MSRYAEAALEMSLRQKEAILELGSRGSGGSFDPQAMSELFTLGMVEVRNTDRRLVLTDRGRAVYGDLAKS